MFRSHIGLVIWVVAAVPSFAASPTDLGIRVAASLPPEVVEVLKGSTESGRLELTSRFNPFYLQGDFDGDGDHDTAILARDRSKGKEGIIIVRGNGAVNVVGAGIAIGDGGDDFEWMDAWYVYRKGKVGQGAIEDAPPALKGDAIMAIKTGTSSGLIFWDGAKFEWHQQGD